MLLDLDRGVYTSDEGETMRLIARDRRQGKTTELIRLADTSKQVGWYIVCARRADCVHVSSLAISMGIDIHFPLTMREATAPLGHGVRALLIDDVDRVLQDVASREIKVVTITADGTEGDS